MVSTLKERHRGTEGSWGVNKGINWGTKWHKDTKGSGDGMMMQQKPLGG